MAWHRRTLATLAICAATHASLLACNGSEFSSASGSDAGSAGSGGKPSSTGGKSTGGSGVSQGGKAGGGGAASAGTQATGGQINSGGVGGANPTGGSGGVGGAVPPVFQAPSESLLYWFSADVGVFSDAGGVTLWKNRATNGFDAKQDELEQRPALMSAMELPLPVVAFDGVDDYMELPELDTMWEGGLSVFVVAGSSATTTCSAFIELSNGPEVNDINLGAHGDSVQYEIDQAFLTGEAGSFPVGELRLVQAHHGSGADQPPIELRVNGTQVGSTVMALPPSVTRISNFLGRSLYSTCVTYSGGIAELLMYTRKLTPDERASIELYLIEKWQCCK